MLEYAALVASPRALPDGLILVFQHPAKTMIRSLQKTFQKQGARTRENPMDYVYRKEEG